MSDPILSVNNVTKFYKAGPTLVRALDGVTLPIARGEVLSLLGVNGAGKTTLSSILATLHPPTSGDVLFNGESIYDDLVTYRNAIGFCPQHPNLDPDLTVEENLLFAGRYFLLPAAVIQERMHKLMEQFGLTKYASFHVKALSGGYQQRLSIARALMHKPAIVILDEPTVGLDPDIRHQLWDIIRDLRKQGITVILTTHYLEEAELLSDRVCILNKGKIILTATVDDLKQKHNKQTLEEVFLELIGQENEL